jgi:hypothetical protein
MRAVKTCSDGLAWGKIPAACQVFLAGNFFLARLFLFFHATDDANTCFPVLQFTSEKRKISDQKPGGTENRGLSGREQNKDRKSRMALAR